MLPSLREIFWALTGNIVVGIGAGTATLAAFSPTVPAVDGSNPIIRVAVVSVGFAFFFAGYRFTQAGTHRDPDEPLLSAFVSDDVAGSSPGTNSAFLAIRGVFIVIGVVGLGAGMRLFALTIQSWSVQLGITCGVVCILGYIAGHIGMNGVAL